MSLSGSYLIVCVFCWEGEWLRQSPSVGYLQVSGVLAPPPSHSHPITGAADDLKKVTQLAYRQVAEAGMSEQVGHISFPSQSEVVGRRPYSKWLAAQIDGEVYYVAI